MQIRTAYTLAALATLFGCHRPPPPSPLVVAKDAGPVSVDIGGIEGDAAAPELEVIGVRSNSRGRYAVTISREPAADASRERDASSVSVFSFDASYGGAHRASLPDCPRRTDFAAGGDRQMFLCADGATLRPYVHDGSRWQEREPLPGCDPNWTHRLYVNASVLAVTCGHVVHVADGDGHWQSIPFEPEPAGARCTGVIATRSSVLLSLVRGEAGGALRIDRLGRRQQKLDLGNPVPLTRAMTTMADGSVNLLASIGSTTTVYSVDAGFTSARVLATNIDPATVGPIVKYAGEGALRLPPTTANHVRLPHVAFEEISDDGLVLYAGSYGAFDLRRGAKQANWSGATRNLERLVDGPIYVSGFDALSATRVLVTTRATGAFVLEAADDSAKRVEFFF